MYRARPTLPRPWLLGPRMLGPWIVLGVVLGVANAANAAGATSGRAYHIAYHAQFEPAKGGVLARITIRQKGGELVRLDLAAPAALYADFKADGSVERDGERVAWEVPDEGGVLTYRVQVDQKRPQRSACEEHPCASATEVYDARLTTRWALLRLDDLFPRARVRRLVGSTATASLALGGPKGWSFETRYGSVANDPVAIVDPARRFDRPTGWLVAGEIGVRRDVISARRVAVAAPVHHGVRRQDLLAFLRWTLPALVDIFPGFPERLLIASAGDAMWRGGLSGPASLYLHAERPFISENGTSAVLHELVHVAMSGTFEGAADWIVEGLAEYYSLNVLRRTGGISARRYARSLSELRAWSEAGGGELRDPSHGPHTARAVLLFDALAQELEAADRSLDELVGRLGEADAADMAEVKRIARDLLGKPSKALR